ncbi:unnamed protein product [Arabidopsis arenosa]|uniref:Uncharacterized protein n=1 Tax=Arabidopsis arenosa TaxID=38785 RepID=A0A8S2AWR8_ARAAE|nr:unnamed protein product [Arabidopsis arenosa]
MDIDDKRSFSELNNLAFAYGFLGGEAESWFNKRQTMVAFEKWMDKSGNDPKDGYNIAEATRINSSNETKILGSAYNRHEPWEMGVHKRKGTIYLDVHKLPERPQSGLDRRRCYWGYCFESLATEDPGRPYREEIHHVDANVEFCSVVKTKLGTHRVLMGAEMDCCDETGEGRRYYVELKTSRELDDRTVDRFEREKLLKFWIQSFVAGVPYIIVGYRDDGGRIVRTERLKTKDIAHRARLKNFWQGGVCLAFADEVLCWLYGTVKDNEDYILQFVHLFMRLELLQAQSCPDAITNHKGTGKRKRTLEFSMEELNQKIATAISQSAVEDLEKMVEALSAETLPNFLDRVYDSVSDPSPAVRKECLQLLSNVCRVHSDLAASYLTGIIARIVNMLKDSKSSLACQDTIGSLAGIYLKEGNNTGSASSVVALFMEPLLDAMGEENVEVQSGAAMCLARMVDAGAGSLITSFERFFPRVNKLLTSSKFLAKGSLSPVVTRLAQQLPRAGRKRREPEPANRAWIHSFLVMHDVPDEVIVAIETKTPYGRMERRVARTGEIFMQWGVQEIRENKDIKPEDSGALVWTPRAGVVRNQSDHGTDQCSAWRYINRLDDHFVTLSARYLTYYVSESMREEAAAHGDRPETHHCHGYHIKDAIEFIRDKGVPEEDPNDAINGFSCVYERPEQFPSSPLYNLPREVRVVVSDDLMDLYRMLRTQPVGANVHFFHPEFDQIGGGIYVGCTSDGSEYKGLHSVIVVALTRENNKLVAVVKSSHGTEKGNGGYMFVSLTRMLVDVGYRGSKHIYGRRKAVEVKSPSYLLRDFTFIESPPTTSETPKSGSGKSKRKKRKVSGCKETSGVGSAAGEGLGDGGSSSTPSVSAVDKQ